MSIPGKMRKHVARNIAAYSCFAVLPQEKQCFWQQSMFLPASRNILCCWKQCFQCGKTRKHRGNICPQECFWQHVSSFSQGLIGLCYKRTVYAHAECSTLFFKILTLNSNVFLGNIIMLLSKKHRCCRYQDW